MKIPDVDIISTHTERKASEMATSTFQISNDRYISRMNGAKFSSHANGISFSLHPKVSHSIYWEETREERHTNPMHHSDQNGCCCCCSNGIDDCLLQKYTQTVCAVRVWGERKRVTGIIFDWQRMFWERERKRNKKWISHHHYHTLARSLAIRERERCII
jgi:hypothetical protein